MQGEHFFRDLAAVMLAAGLMALLFQKLRQPKVLGYILAGLILGPHTPPFPLIRDEATIRLLADLGVIFLMFSVGLEFNLRRLRKVGTTACVTAGMDTAVMLWLGYMLGRALGWSTVESLFLGGIICDSSTTILARALQELGRTREKFAGIAVGITLMEDVLAIGVMAVLTGVAATGSWHAELAANQMWMLLLFLAVVLLVGLLTLPRLLNYVQRLGNEETLLLVLLGIGCTVTLAADHLQLSMALGAVLVGALASESRAAVRISVLMEPLRFMFGAVFFVAVGLMLNPVMLVRHAWPVLAVTALILGGKFITNTLGALLTGHDMPTAVRVGAGMAQVGEFAFIIAALGMSLGATGEPVYQVGVTAAVLSIILSPQVLNGADHLAAMIEKSPNCSRWTMPFHVYGQWTERIRRHGPSGVVARAVRRATVVMISSVLLITVVLASAGYLAHQSPAFLARLPVRPEFVAVILWLCAMVVCWPLYAAFFGKLHGLGMLLAEFAVPAIHEAPWARPARSFVANAILAAGAIGLALLTFLLSATLFPTREMLFLLMAIATAGGFWGWRSLARTYRHARISLETMLGGNEGESEDGSSAPLPTRDTETVFGLQVGRATIMPQSTAAGRELRALLLRTRTGATLIGIERAGRRLINPDPGELLQVGDRVFLLGEPGQIQQACQLLSQPEAT